MLFVCYSKCSTCKKAQKWLDEAGIKYDIRDIKTENPSAEELKSWHAKSDYPIKRFWNTSGIQYRELNMKDKLPTMNEEAQIEFLSRDGMLVKRPILVGEDFVLVGFKAEEWAEKIKK